MNATLKDIIVSQIDATMDIELNEYQISEVCKGVLYYIQESGLVEDVVSIVTEE